MFRRYIPFAHASNIFEIDVSFFEKFGIKTILCDLDNTLDSYKQKTPTEKVYKLKETLNKHGITLMLLSNNTGSRVSMYAKELGVNYFSSVGKPFSRKLRKLLKENNLDANTTLVVGDQTTTDIPCGNGAKLKTILTDKIVDEDQPTTRFNRLFDRPIRKNLKKHNLLIDWSDK